MAREYFYNTGTSDSAGYVDNAGTLAKNSSTTPKSPSEPDYSIASAQQLVNEIAAQTGQEIDPATGQIIIDPTKVAAKLGITQSSSGNTPSDITLVDTTTDEYGNKVGIYSDGSTKVLVQSGRQYRSTVDEDAYAIIEKTFADAGLEELIPVIKGYMDKGLGSNQAALELRKEKVYQDRFAGNFARAKAGLNVLSEGEYLALEDSYSQTLKAYGVSNYFGTDRKARQKAAAEIIGNDISAEEFKSRVDTISTRVQNSDVNTRNAFKALYGVTDTDLFKYFADPKVGSEELKIKASAAEISGAAVGAGLTGTDLSTSEELAKLGIGKAQAIAGYSSIAETLPTADFLSQVYDKSGITYDRTDAESEAFKGTASAKRKREKLAALETNAFSGSSGNLQSTRPRSTAGMF